MSINSGEIEKVLVHRYRRTRAKASEKVGKDLTYQLFCLLEFKAINQGTKNTRPKKPRRARYTNLRITFMPQNPKITNQPSYQCRRYVRLLVSQTAIIRSLIRLDFVNSKRYEAKM